MTFPTDLSAAGLAWDFIDYATQYYLLGRVAATSYMFSTVGWIFHNAIEYYLKGLLIPENSAAELKNKYHHNLETLWIDVVKKYQSLRLGDFEKDIKSINTFANIRYPDGKDPEAMAISISAQDETLLADSLEGYGGTIYRVNVSKLDLLVSTILLAGQHKPSFYFVKYKEIFRGLFPPLPKDFIGDE